jgi:hypothetical protein
VFGGKSASGNLKEIMANRGVKYVAMEGYHSYVVQDGQCRPLVAADIGACSSNALRHGEVQVIDP